MLTEAQLMNLAKMPTHRDAGANEFPAYFTRFAFCDEHPRRTSDGDADAMDVDGDDVLPVEDIRRSLTATINNLRKPKPGFSQKAIGDRLDQFILDLPNNPNAPTASRPGTSAEVEIFNGIRKRGADGAYIVPHELMQRHLKCFTELAASTHGPNDGANAAYLSGNGYHSGGNNGGGRGNRGGRGNYQDGHNNNQNGGYNGNNNNNGNGNGNNGNGNNGGNNGGNGGGGGSSGRGGHRGGRGNRGN